MSSQREFYKTTYEVVVLSEGPMDSDYDLGNVHYAIVRGDCSGRFMLKKSEPVSGEEMARLLVSQGSDPEFLGLDELGNDLDEDDDEPDPTFFGLDAQGNDLQTESDG